MKVYCYIAMAIAYLLLCRGCDSVRSFFGKPTSEDISILRTLQDELRSSSVDTAALVETEAVPQEDAPADSLEAGFQYSYYIVAGSFKEDSNAEKLRVVLRERGYDIIDITTGGGLHAVAVFGCNDREEASSAMERLSEDKTFPYGLWMYDTNSNK